MKFFYTASLHGAHGPMTIFNDQLYVSNKGVLHNETVIARMVDMRIMG